MINPRPLELRPEDSPAPLRALPAPEPDPQSIGIELLALLRDLAEEAVELLALYSRAHGDPIDVQRRARDRVIEVRRLAIEAEPLGESLLRAMRAAGHLSVGDRNGR